MNTTEKTTLSYELSKTQESAGMKDYFMKNTATLATLPTGEIIPVDKEHIETRFCFGESGYDADEAHAACNRAYKDERYFIEQNMQKYNQSIRWLKECLESDSGYFVTVWPFRGDQQEDCNLRFYGILSTQSVLKHFNGMAYLNDLPGKSWSEPEGYSVRVATKEDIHAIITAYEEAARQHEKKLGAYLKRHGLSKVYAWTYWRDE